MYRYPRKRAHTDDICDLSEPGERKEGCLAIRRGDVKDANASPLITDMVSLLADDREQLTIIPRGAAPDTIALVGRLLGGMSMAEIEAEVERMLSSPDRSTYTKLRDAYIKLRDAYTELDRLGFQTMIRTIHTGLQRCLHVRRTWTLSDVLHAFDCHPGVLAAVVDPLVDAAHRLSLLEAEEDGPDHELVEKIIGELGPGQSVLIANDLRKDYDCFLSGAVIVRIPTCVALPRVQIESDKITPKNVADFHSMSIDEIVALSVEENTRLFREYAEYRQHKGRWRRVSMEPALAVAGHAGEWATWFIAGVAAEMDATIPVQTRRRHYSHGFTEHGHWSEMQYLVMSLPSPCGGDNISSITVSNPNLWLGHDYGGDQSQTFGDLDFDEDASVFATLTEAVAAVTAFCGPVKVELIAKATAVGEPVKVLFRSRLFQTLDVDAQENIEIYLPSY